MDPSATAIELREEKMDSLPGYMSVSSVLDVDSILDVAETSGRYEVLSYFSDSRLQLSLAS